MSEATKELDLSVKQETTIFNPSTIHRLLDDMMKNADKTPLVMHLDTPMAARWIRTVQPHPLDASRTAVNYSRDESSMTDTLIPDAAMLAGPFIRVIKGKNAFGDYERLCINFALEEYPVWQVLAVDVRQGKYLSQSFDNDLEVIKVRVTDQWMNNPGV